jgi:hypothetical protein
MAKVNLSRMDLETLVNLRQQVQERLHEHRQRSRSTLRVSAAWLVRVGQHGWVLAMDARSALKGRRSPRNIVVPLARLGRVAVQGPDGLLRRSKVGRSRRFLDPQIAAKRAEKA